MSIRETIQFIPGIDIEQYLEVLKTDYCVDAHPSQPGAFLVDGLPFYCPKTLSGHTFILGFNYAPLPNVLLKPLIYNPELFSSDHLIRWTQEQELIMETTLSELRNQDTADA